MSKVDWWRYPTLRVWVLLSLVLVIQANATSQRTRTEYNAKRIKGLIAALKKQLAIPQEIESVVVPKNALIVSVQPIRERKGVFQISFEESFLNTLDNAELRAVIAHELGHVWIYTHHPFLQTERLANDVAMRVINRSAFEPVYEKVWQRTGIKGNLVEFLGPPNQ